MRAFRLLCLFAWLALAGTGLAQEKMKVAAFFPRTNDAFWDSFRFFMAEAASDLGVELVQYDAEKNHLKMVKQVKEAVSAADKPDFLVVQNYKGQGVQMLKIAEAAQVPIFFVNAGFQLKDGVGAPRETYKYWIGEMLPNDQKAGNEQAEILYKLVKEKGVEKPRFAAITGNRADGASIERLKGLEQFMSAHSDIELMQTVYTDWSPQSAVQKYDGLVKRYGDLDFVWIGGAGIALGVQKHLKETGVQEVIGAISWNPDCLLGIENGEIATSVGGLSMEGGWALVLLFDYFKGIDFKSESVQFKSDMKAITKANLANYKKLLDQGNWAKLDFTKLSKFYNKELTTYNFSADELLKQL